MEKINIDGIENDIDRETARRAFYNTSHIPERRGDSVITSYIEEMKSLAEYIYGAAQDERQKAIAQSVFDGLREKYRAKTQKWLWAQSRCLSAFIVGPAKFPVRRAEKANRAERGRSDDLLHFSRNMRGYALKALEKEIPREEKQENEREALRRRIDNVERLQKFMKTANALLRKKDMDALEAHFISAYSAEADARAALANFLNPSYTGAVWGFEHWQLSNNLANIKRMKARLAELEAKAEKAASEGRAPVEKLNGLEIVRNHPQDRLQLVFEGKPPEHVRDLLKKNGFKWSPRFGAWQRQLTANAEAVLSGRILKSAAMASYLSA